jgi:uncharacterized protein (DUF433 family)
MPETYTLTEAAAVIGAPVKDVNNLIDKRVLPKGAVQGRRLPKAALVSLKAVHATADVLTPEQRRVVATLMLEKPRARTWRVGVLSVNLQEVAEETRLGLERLQRARDMVVGDRNVLGGAPVFRGPRIPVHDIAAMLTNGDSVQELRRAYPALNREQIELAPLYAKAYPLRGRPRGHAWQRLQRVTSKKIRSKELPKGRS